MPSQESNDEYDVDDELDEESGDWRPLGWDRITSEPITLKATIGRWTMFFTLLVFGACWNGVIGLGVWSVAHDFLRGSPNWALSLLLLPFVAIGLALLWGIVYTFLQTFNPVPTMTLSSGAAPLGADVDLTWVFTGATSRLNRVLIELEGREEATYRRGTSTSTDKSVFARITVVDTTDSVEMESGTTTFRVPTHSMHSFDSGRNKIVWHLHIKGEVAFWPDVSEEYPIIVLPHVGALDLQQ
ncbi:MAG: hypothetical protein KF708_23175 [Pirellulales bacterium]|nr:hypothetical protein [Pirellulales bacterium]